MSIEALAASAAGTVAMPPPDIVQAGPGASLTDIGGFQGALNAAGLGPSAPQALDPAMKSVATQLEKLNGEMKSVSDYAEAASANGRDMTPGEVIQLTMRCQEFMFHCQLTSNVANRTSDGLQQLFRQQS